MSTAVEEPLTFLFVRLIIPQDTKSVNYYTVKVSVVCVNFLKGMNNKENMHMYESLYI